MCPIVSAQGEGEGEGGETKAAPSFNLVVREFSDFAVRHEVPRPATLSTAHGTRCPALFFPSRTEPLRRRQPAHQGE